VQPLKYVEVTIKFKTKTFDVANVLKHTVPPVVAGINEQEDLKVTNVSVRKP
jgi:hypothetical protein